MHDYCYGRLKFDIQGAPERILDRCSTIMINGEEQELTDQWKTKYNDVSYFLAQGANESYNMSHMV